MSAEPVTRAESNSLLPALPGITLDESAFQRSVDAEVAGERSRKAPDMSQVMALVADVQRDLNVIHNVNLQFSVHETSGRVMVTVRDESTGEVIREIPSSQILNLAAKMNEMVGLIFDQKG